METDRHASDGTPDPDSPDSYEYGYGEDPLEAAGTGGPRAADSGAADLDAADGATEGSIEAGGGAESAAGDDPATGASSPTSLRSATTPRAVLRPIPEGFPTPPPRPARPNRRPAPKPEASATPAPRRRLLIAGIAIAAALLLIVVVGGGILAVRSFSPTAPAPTAADDPESQSSPDQAGPGSTEIDEVTLTEVSTEVGVRSVGGSSSRMDPAGEFVIVTFEVQNSRSDSVQIGDNVSLETPDGTYPVDSEATRAHSADTLDFGMVPPDDSQSFHAVFDVPIGADPTGLHLELTEAGENGTLPLSG